MSDRARDTAVIDIDGVLADVRHRLHHLRTRPKDWDAFFAAAQHDPPLPRASPSCGRWQTDTASSTCRGGPSASGGVTERWLRQHGAPPGTLLLRRDGDLRPARRVKLERLRELQARVVVVVDDDPAVCATLRAAGFPVLQATWGFGEENEHGEAARTLHEAQERNGRS